MRSFGYSARLGWLMASALIVSACGGGGGGGGAPAPATAEAGRHGSTAPPTINSPPVVSGSPQADATVGSAYVFQPSASDPEGDPIEFQVANKPAWAIFDSRTGRLAGTPAEADVGTYANIVISVSDGRATATLVPFSIAVSHNQLGAATLTWLPPTENTDGSPIEDLAGYRIRYGRHPAELTELQNIPNPGISGAVVENLSRGTWYFAVTAYNTAGIESEYSNLAEKAIL
jgi:hypothetical protein